ncbi:Tetratricopeptide repeat protein 25 [Lamellibrachia satsuma]|nr:Tetratricopeptide repeat protein 25 [Lamellibrachia satsuma]
MLLKADALYTIGEFEQALVYYQRGRCLRPTIHNFRLGIQKTEETIMNSLGDPSVVKLDLEGDLSHFNKFKENEEYDGKTELRDSSSRSNAAYDTNLPKARLRRKAKTVRQLLGQLYHDLDYVNELMRDIKDMHPDGHNMLREIKNFLNSRADFWQQEMPIYFRRYDRWLQRREAKCLHKANFMQTYLKGLVKLIDTELEDWQYSNALRHGKRALQMTQSYQGYLHDRISLQTALRYRIARASDLLGDSQCAIQNYKRVILVATSRSCAPLKMKIFNHLADILNNQNDPKEALNIWMWLLSVADCSIERAFLYHEIGRWHVKLENFSKALEWGDKTLIEGQLAKDPQWQIYGLVLMAQALVAMQDLPAARENYESALLVAKIMKNKKLLAALTIALTRLIREIHRSEAVDGETLDTPWLAVNKIDMMYSKLHREDAKQLRSRASYTAVDYL